MAVKNITRSPRLGIFGAALSILVVAPILVYGIGGDAVAESADRPVVWTTDADIEDAKQRVTNQEEPYYTSWLMTREHADNALDDELVPYQGPDPDRYFIDGRDQAKQTRSLALAYRISGEQVYLNAAKEVLGDWAQDAIEYPYGPPADFPDFDAFPSSDLPHGAGLRIGRIMSTFADAYGLMWPEMSAAERDDVDQWMRLMLPPIKESQRQWEEEHHKNNEPPWMGHNYYNNHLSAHILGMAAIGYAVQDQEIIDHALTGSDNPRNLETMIENAILMPGDEVYRDDPSNNGAPNAKAGEMWDRYRIINTPSKGLFYSLTHIRFLALTVEMTHNNDGVDYYDYQAPGGENLELAFERYSPWFVTGDPNSVNDGYYPTSEDYSRLAPEISTWELAGRHYPDNEKIQDALSTHKRLLFDAETWGWSAPLTNGPPLGE